MYARRDKLLSLFYPYPLSLLSPFLSFPRSLVAATLIVIARLTRVPSPYVVRARSSFELGLPFRKNIESRFSGENQPWNE